MYVCMYVYIYMYIYIHGSPLSRPPLKRQKVAILELLVYEVRLKNPITSDIWSINEGFPSDLCFKISGGTHRMLRVAYGYHQR